ncbi:TPA: hypothetical protein NI618_001728 [Pseudomonas aeruginosa]|jgi:hypothetical protein|uniref:Uncharacterized protein n=1 Tax=Pseudomonas putida TaxID=303 RepID=A0A1L7NMP5_PSEPU|nr:MULTISPECIES: hypothetical protein [Pseudomonas]MCS7526979.1 hypothetical protein [Pseudomonas aeruginosa]MCS8510333.1 hypothetical protein [Pseudomonas aeruginosa]MCS8541159.1 hypothetical protein [Pseudomonas aeruginosa]MCT0600305.1 hypothetical protein [Pseudomonas aeruginosa]MCV4061316.1 hypothetical protein [Pseudomonas aeruginosa]
MATSDNQDLDNSQKAEAERIAGLFDTLKDRVIAAGYSDKLSDEEVADLRTEMAVLSSQYFDLTGVVLS